MLGALFEILFYRYFNNIGVISFILSCAPFFQIVERELAWQHFPQERIGKRMGSNVDGTLGSGQSQNRKGRT
jgi:hypothetical protein